jgi:hypothetical protein
VYLRTRQATCRENVNVYVAIFRFYINPSRCISTWIVSYGSRERIFPLQEKQAQEQAMFLMVEIIR